MSTPKFLRIHRQFVTTLGLSLSTSTSLASQGRNRVPVSLRGTESSSLQDPPFKGLPDTNIVSPSLRNKVHSWFLSRALITPYFDSEFSLEEFEKGASHAAVIVANCIADCDLDSLNGLVTSEALKEIVRNLRVIPPDDRRLLAVSEDDVYFSFVYDINFNVLTKNLKIVWVGHFFPNYIDVIAEHKNILEIKKHMNAEGGPMVLNYQFIRKLTTNVEDTWRINGGKAFQCQI